MGVFLQQDKEEPHIAEHQTETAERRQVNNGPVKKCLY